VNHTPHQYGQSVGIWKISSFQWLCPSSWSGMAPWWLLNTSLRYPNFVYKKLMGATSFMASSITKSPNSHYSVELPIVSGGGLPQCCGFQSRRLPFHWALGLLRPFDNNKAGWLGHIFE
jgi:hypothetical protein